MARQYQIPAGSHHNIQNILIFRVFFSIFYIFLNFLLYIWQRGQNATQMARRYQIPISKILYYLMFFSILYIFLNFLLYIWHRGPQSHTLHRWLGNIKFHLKVIRFKRWRPLTELTKAPYYQLLGIKMTSPNTQDWHESCNPAEESETSGAEKGNRPN